MIEHQISTHSHTGDHSVAERIGPVLIDDVKRIDAVPERLGHLDVIGVAHGSVQVNGVERGRVHEGIAGHDHARHPEEENLRRRNQVVGRIERSQRRRALVGPTESGNGEEPRREPGVEHILVLPHGTAAFVAGAYVGATHYLLVALVAVPYRYAVPPPELSRDVPVANVLEPIDIDCFPALRQNANSSIAHGCESGFRQRLHLHEPLVGETAARRQCRSGSNVEWRADAARPSSAGLISRAT